MNKPEIPILSTAEAQQRQCPYRQHLPCMTSACMGWVLVDADKRLGYCGLVHAPGNRG